MGILRCQPLSLSKEDRNYLLNIHANGIETYTFKDWDLGNILFNVTALRMLIANDRVPYSYMRAELTDEFVNHIKKCGGHEENYVPLIPHYHLNRPVIGAVFHTGESVIIDGNNRIIRRYQLHKKTFKLITVPWPEWRPYSYWGIAGELANMSDDLENKFKALPDRSEIDAKL